MSWLAPSEAERTYVAELEADRPLYRLALVLAPALRVEPLVLRNARLRFLPDTEATLEARFWFSPLVANRSARSVMVRTGLARILTDRLDQPDAPFTFTFTEIWHFIEQHTAHWPALDRLEQELRQAARRGDKYRIRVGLQEVLRRLDREPRDGERRELARWVKGALPDIAAADGSIAPTEVGLVAQFAGASLGDPSGGLSRRAAGGGLPSWLAALVPAGKGYTLGLRLRPGVLECVTPEAGGHRLDLDLPPPVPVHIRRADGVPDSGRWEPLLVGRNLPLPRGCRRFILTTPKGERFLLEATPADSEAPEKFPSAGPTEARSVVVAHLPEDREAAVRVAKLLASAGIEAKLVAEGLAAAAAEEGAVVVLRLWTQAAARQAASLESVEQAPSEGLVLRMDETPLAEGVGGDLRIIDLSRWQGDPHAESAKVLLEAMRTLVPTQPKPTHVEVELAGASVRVEAGTMGVTVRYSGRVFLTYAYQDEKRAEQIAKLLQAEGFEVRSDAALYPGEVWPRRIGEEIANSHCSLVLWSARAWRSRWVELETTVVLEPDKVLSVLIDDKGLEVPFRFTKGRLQDLTEWDGSPEQPAFRALVTAVAQVVQASRERQQKMAAEAPAEPGARRDHHTDANHRYPPEIESLLAELDREETPPERRLAIGDRLAALGDPRPGVGLSPDGLPDIDWVAVPAGEFLFGDDQRRARTDAFRISRHLVTNAQYQAFIDAGGYHEERWWQGLAQHVERPKASRWPHPNRPRTDVSWYEAVAFCRWLSAALGMDIRLPAEIEWEKAARGSDGREYPWGNGYRAGCANINETWGKVGPHDLQQTTAVGIYPQGASPYGVLDLAGNVWEWCLNEFGKPERIQTDGTETRVLRGGSWFDHQDYARSASRDGSGPVYRNHFIGFRVLCSSPISGH